jgi:hypothetical protein
MNDPVVPLSEVELHLKQVQQAALNELGRAAMARAFTGFSDQNIRSPERIASYLAEMRALTGVENTNFDPRPYRRFAGDPSLPRSRYFTIARDATGEDQGTLVRELRTYYNPQNAGIIQIFDTTNLGDKEFLSGVAGGEPWIAVVFLPLAGRPNTFASTYTELAQPLIVLLPLRLETRRVKGVVDLRQPETARVFAQELSRLEWDVEGAKLPCFPMRPRLSGFSQLLPSLLEQSLGGGGLTNIVGVWLRRMGASGLIFPSARVDASVGVRKGTVVDAAGWNFVDYAGTSATELQAFVDVRDSWPSSIVHTPEGPNEDWIYPIPAVWIEFAGPGQHEGSWKVHGFRSARDALWRSLMARVCVDAFAENGEDEAVRPVYEWMFALFSRVFPRHRVSEAPPEPRDPALCSKDVEVLGRSCTVLQEALLGDKHRQSQLREYASMAEEENRELATAIKLLLSRAQGMSG